MRLFYDKITESYYTDSDYECTNCNEPIENVMLLVTFWHNKESWINTFCKECFQRIKNWEVTSEHKLIVLATPPQTAIVVPIRKPELGNGRCDCVFMAANLKSETTNDYTKYSGQTIQGAMIGSQARIRDDVILTENEAHNVLLGLRGK